MVKFCTECGKKIVGKPEHCPECGHVLPVIKSKKVSNATHSIDRSRLLLKIYLIYGIISIIIALFVMFGFQKWDEKLLLAGGILIIVAGLLLIFSYNQIFHGKKYASIATIGCIIGIVGSFFPAIYFISESLEPITLLIIPIILFTLMIVYIAFLIMTLLWRTK